MTKVLLAKTQLNLVKIEMIFLMIEFIKLSTNKKT